MQPDENPEDATDENPEASYLSRRAAGRFACNQFILALALLALLALFALLALLALLALATQLLTVEC